MAGRISQETVEVGYQGSPKARVTQEVVETAYAGSPKGRLTQVVMEVVYIDSGVTPPTATPRFYASIVG